MEIFKLVLQCMLMVIGSIDMLKENYSKSTNSFVMALLVGQS